MMSRSTMKRSHRPSLRQLWLMLRILLLTLALIRLLRKLLRN